MHESSAADDRTKYFERAPSSGSAPFLKDHPKCPKAKRIQAAPKSSAKRRADQQRRAVPQTYVVMLDQLRAVLNKRFYEEQGFPHLEILAERYKGPVTTGHLSNYFELQHFFIGMGAAHGQCALCGAQVLDGAA